ncbi:MAG: hypothetical protein AAGE65_05430 [Planctomycetota bacterium]
MNRMNPLLLQEPGSDPAVSTDTALTFTGSIVLDLILVGGLIVSCFALVWLAKKI